MGFRTAGSCGRRLGKEEMMEALQELEERLGYMFHNIELLRGALYHSSYANEHRSMGISSNERLEFLGDAVLGFVSAEFLYRKHPDLPESGGGRRRPSILADAVEAVLAAVYLDGGIDPARALVHRVLLEKEREEVVESRRRDCKTELQELVQRKPNQELHYEPVSESGPDHAKVFTVAVMLNGQVIGLGSGHSKKEAEQSAARTALEQMK